MYFTKFFALSAITTLAVATAVKRTGGGGGGEGGGEEPPVQCCQSVTKASDPSAAAVLAAIGVIVDDVNVLVGLNCSPITVIGGGNGACSGGTTVTCTDNSHGGLINIGCVPVTI
ncbi:hypothetical protein PQX77_014158 [Marasmius sp. AFHP31]|nr:hypothetical protein PQX77_014158 [Marasmius sp. AFHP31]